MNHLLRALAPALLLLVGLPASSSYAQEKRPDLTSAEVEQARKAAEASKTLDDAAKKAVLAVYDEALAELRKAATWSKQATDLEGEVAAAKVQGRQIKTDLEKQPPAAPKPEVPSGATLAELERRLREADAAAKAAAEQVKLFEEEQAKRKEEGAALAKASAEAEERLKKVVLLKLTPKATPLERARAVLARAQRQSGAAEALAARRALSRFEARLELLPLLLDQAGRRKRVADDLAEAWRKLVTTEREDQAKRAQRQAERLRQTTREIPELKRVADEVQALANLRTGTGEVAGTTADIEQAETRLVQVVKDLTQVQEDSRGARRKVGAVGMSTSMGLLLRKLLEGLPDVAGLRREMARRAERVGEVQLQHIIRSEQRVRAGDIPAAVAAVLEQVAPQRPELDKAVLEQVAGETFKARRDSLDGLIADYDKLFTKLVELNTVSQQLVTATEEFQGYIEERILWVPSVTGSAVPDPAKAGQGLAWLFASPAWGAASGRSWRHLREHGWAALLALLFIVALVASRFGSKGRVAAMAEVVERDPRDSFAHTAKAFAIVVVRSLAFPALLYGLGWTLAAPHDQAGPALAAGAGLKAAAWALFAFEFLRQVMLSRGLGEVHFRWPPATCAYVRWHLRWFLPLKVLATFLVVAMDVQQQDTLWNDALGRSAFVLDNLALVAFLQRILHPGGPVFEELGRQGEQDGWLHRLRRPVYLLAVAVPLVLVALALRGYFYTALRLQDRLQASIWLVLALVFGHALFLRWLRVARRALRAAEPGAPPAAPAVVSPRDDSKPDGGDEVGEAEAGHPEAGGPDSSDAATRARALIGVELGRESDGRLALPEIDAQTRHLFRSAMILALVLGMYFIWADVLPALRRLDQVHIYPELRLVDPAVEPVPSRPAAPGAATAVVVTLADLGLALLVLAFTLVAARNVPGSLEILVLGRLPLDPGGRYAAIALTRYTIVLVGVPFALSRIGLTWDSVQWLAAALTFGLAFGLQEIFANFVSGLIILFERPIRVGDVVTVSGTSGVVTRIRMRATTVTDFDRKELIVPNKRFVTGEVLNWVLTDAVVRVVIPIGVGYSAQVEQARQLMLDVSAQHPLVLDRPPPSCQLKALGPSTFDFELWVFVASAQDMTTVRHDVSRDVHRALSAAGVDLPFPQQDVHIRSADPLADALRRPPAP